MKIVRLRLILFLAAITAAVPTVALASRAKQLEFESYLLGKSEIPAAAAKGKATVNLKVTGTKVCWKFTKVSGIDKPLAAHIHRGTAKTASGPVVVPLGAKYAATGCIASTAAVTAAIAKNPKGFYVNIHTAKFPNGAVRGQLHAGD